ncbi:Alpha/Beta hydrolase protein [Dactylonectria estremocensis]|uniref:Alpha/Beta hydrolase protein n=1 Tax=Dactylonectria estremocensis TaxID=1079267 RepID=A0A9P9J2I7_9HYPO|nr:Alpha/Beta hydrolase protein [Dactylonectria estremocensis]
MATTRDVDIPTYDGLKLKATFYGVGPARPCIIMSSGFSGLRDHFLPDFASRFNAAGYGVLAYDNRCWGDSEGTPRDEVDPWLQTRDYFDVFNYAATLPDVDPSKIVYWGSSMSGGNVICAAAVNKKIAAVIAQVPFASGEAIARIPGTSTSFLTDNRSAESQIQVPVWPSSADDVLSGTSKAVLKDPEAVAFIAELDRRGLDYSRVCTLQSLTNTVLHEPQAYIHRISPTPLLMVVADQDVTTMAHLQFAAFEKALQPKTLKVLKGVGHFSPYYGDTFEENIKAQLEFLKDVLGPGAVN